jgi:predicted AAA+ superfamily ATPase
MPPNQYIPRIIDEELKTRLESSGAVLIEGPKACGKTESAKQLAASEVLLDVDQNARAAVAVNPNLVLDGETPRLIDEWQVEPEIWNHIRRAVDERGDPGQFILAGSAAPTDEITRHSGAGRISRLRMRPMSLLEAGASSGEISLQKLMSKEEARAAQTELGVPGIAEEIARGGWPALRSREIEPAMVGVRDYLKEISRTDISQVDNVRRDPERVRRLLSSLARNVATTTSTATLAKDTATGGEAVKEQTIAGYISALERLFVVENQPAWTPHLRSRSRLRQAAKRHFIDPSLAIAALAANPQALLRDLNLFGFLFESLVVRDLRIYSQGLGARIRHYRDNNGLEVDAIVDSPGGWAAIEVKLGGTEAVDEAAANLLKFAQIIDTDKSGEPAFLGVIIGDGFGYVREDGVQVLPIGALGP